MSSSKLIFLVVFISCFQLSVQKKKMISLSFPLKSAPISKNKSTAKAEYLSALTASVMPSPPSGYDYRTYFNYSMALIVSLPIGTPPQAQQMVLDTGSQLSWIKCHKKSPRPRTTFDPSLSSTFSVLPCSHPICKPRIPDFTLPTTCDQNRLCHYSYFYADGTLAEGNLVREKFTLSHSRTTPPLTLGCTAGSAEEQGILGMNLGRLSFASQAKVPRFSYCVPFRRGKNVKPTGTFYLGRNPHSRTFKYINLLSFPRNQHMPNFDPLAYSVSMLGIEIGGVRLNISSAVFRPDAGGSGQTMIDSGTQYTFLVDAAYDKVREHVVRRAGPRLKKGYVYGGSLDMCFDGNSIEIGRLVGDLSFQFENGVEILTNKERVLDDVGDGVHCVGIGRSGSLGVASNIIGNFHQQNHWLEFDVVRKRVGIGGADCRRSL